MLSIGPMSGGQGRYYLQLASEDYYLDGGEPQGRWHGAGAEHLGLAGRVVTGNSLHNLMSGFSPGGDKLVQNAGNETNKSRRPGFDLTFSAPKSVSALWAVAPADVRRAIQECQDAAVKAALNYLEAEAGFARTGKGGKDWHRAGLAVALFEHGTSRAMDPQLHTHALLMNIGWIEAGKTAALVHTKFFESKMTAGALYRVELAEQLRQKLGIGIELDPSAYRKGGLGFRVAGVTDRLCEFWSKRREAIEKQLGAAGMETAVAAAIAAKETREVKEVVPPRADLFKRWAAEARELGHDRGTTADILGRGGSKTVRPSFSELMDKTLAELTPTPDSKTGARAFGLSHFTERQLLLRLAENAQGSGMDIRQLTEQLTVVLRSPKDIGLVELGTDQKQARHFTTEAVVTLETELLGKAAELSRKNVHGFTKKRVETCLEQAADRRTLSDDQKEVVRYLTTRGNGSVRCLEGWAGTGKTTTLAAVAEIYANAGYRLFGTAVAGKAARGLRDGAGIVDSGTLASFEKRTAHSLVREWAHHGKQILKVAAEELSGRQLRLPTVAYDRVKLDSKSVVICDEASMVETRQMKTLIDRVERANALLILVGDRKQAQAIGMGGSFAAIADGCGHRELDQIVRQRDEVDRVAVRDIATGNAGKAIRSFAERGLLIVEEDRTAAVSRLVDEWHRTERKHAKSESLIFVGTNEDARATNRGCQLARLHAGEIVSDERVTIGRDTVHRGDRVLLGKNWKAMDVCNGDLATVVAINTRTPGGSLTVELDSGRRVVLPMRSYSAVTLGYAVTTHKGQGATVERAYVLAGGGMQDREISYVQSSRARGQTRLFASRQEAGEHNQELVKQMERSNQKTLAYTLQHSLEHRH